MKKYSFDCTENINVFCVCPIHERDREIDRLTKELENAILQVKDCADRYSIERKALELQQSWYYHYHKGNMMPTIDYFRKQAQEK